MADNKNLSSYLFTVENAKLYKLDPYEYLRCIFDQPHIANQKKISKNCFQWNIKITEFHEEGTWKNDT